MGPITELICSLLKVTQVKGRKAKISIQAVRLQAVAQVLSKEVRVTWSGSGVGECVY